MSRHPESGTKIKVLRWPSQSPRCFVCKHGELAADIGQPFESNTHDENAFLAALATILEALRMGAEWTDLPDALCDKHGAQLCKILSVSYEIALEEHN